MKILFIQPNYDAHVIHPPLGLGYLASFLRSDRHNVEIFDGTLRNSAISDFVQEVENFSPDLVGISVLTRGHNKAKEIIRVIKSRFKGIPVVIGGAQVTAAPREVTEDLQSDFAVIGEGELTLLELVKEIGRQSGNFKKIKGLAYRDVKSKILVTEPRQLIKNLDSLPFPAWDLMPPDKYRIVPILEPAKAFPIAPILTSRGCPYNCSFCASNVTWQRKLRFRSIGNVIAEIKMLKKDFDIREFHICDDNFTADINRAEQFCEALIAEKINLSWQCPNGVRIDRLPLSLLQKMKKAGCYAVGLGIESGNQKILKKNQKSLDLKIIPEVLKNLKRIGIESYGFFILGLPGDSRQTINETIDFALRNPFDRVWFNLFTPYPGSPAFDEWLGNRHFNMIDWDKHDCSTAVVKIKGLKARELEKIQKKALRKFYLRPEKIFGLLSHLGLKEIKSLIMTRFFSKILKPLFLIVHKAGRRSTIMV